jgi:hypothetical protein
MEEILNDFVTKYPRNKKFEDFLKYYYFTIEKKINSEKQLLQKNKYKKIRNSGLSYIMSNKSKILSYICNY